MSMNASSLSGSCFSISKPNPQFVNSPYSADRQDGHGGYQPMEEDGVVQLMLASVVAENRKDNQSYLVDQMVCTGNLSVIMNLSGWR